MREQKITLGEMRHSGVHGLLIYCADYHCSHHVAISAEPWPDEVWLYEPPRQTRLGNRGDEPFPGTHEITRKPGVISIELRLCPV